MALKCLNKKIAIISDGPSDFKIFKYLTNLIFESHWNGIVSDENYIFSGSINIHTSIEKYIHQVRKTKDYSLFSPQADKLIKEIINVIYIFFSSLKSKKDITLTNTDIIILNTDAEQLMASKNNYFQTWTYTLNNIMWFATEQFYHKMDSEGYCHLDLPLILPIVLFPSSEIILIPCMYHNIESKGFRSMAPNPQLKEHVWGSTFLTDENVEEICSTYLSDIESIKSIFSEIPELRKFIKILTLNP